MMSINIVNYIGIYSKKNKKITKSEKPSSTSLVTTVDVQRGDLFGHCKTMTSNSTIVQQIKQKPKEKPDANMKHSLSPSMKEFDIQLVKRDFVRSFNISQFTVIFHRKVFQQ